MPEPMTAERLRIVFDLFAKTKASVRGVARVAGIPEDEAREVLCGDSYGRERSIYGVRRDTTPRPHVSCNAPYFRTSGNI